MRADRTARTGEAGPGHVANERAARSSTPAAGLLLHGQATGGNQMVLRMLDAAGVAGTGLRVSDPDSPQERQAASVARGGLGSGAGAGLASAAASTPSVLPGAGQPLEPVVRQGLEQSLDADLSRVRVHDDPVAHDFAHDVGARAATVGSHVYFGKGQFAPGTSRGGELLRHELVHTLQPDTGVGLFRSPEQELRLAEIDRLLSSVVITDEYRTQLMDEREGLLREGYVSGMCVLAPPRAVDVLSLSEAEYEALTGLPAAALPEGELPGFTQEAMSPAMSGVPATIGVGSLFTPRMNWYYRVLVPADPTAAELLGGANLVPRAPDPGGAFQPAGSPAEMTFRHTRPGGNVPQVGTDRISTGRNLESFETILAGRGTGEMVRVDVDAARRLGAQFLEQGDVAGHLDEIGRQITDELARAREAGRGRNFIARLEKRLEALEQAKDYVRRFGEGHGVDSIPGGAVSEVRGATLPEAVAAERAFLGRVTVFRYGGRVLLVFGVGMSLARIASAPEDQQARVAAQEAGGWAFSLAGGAAGAKGGALLGAALGWETGPGAVVAVVLGTLIGGAIGFFAGEKAADEAFTIVDRKIEEAASSDWRHFKELNPDATPADYERMQQAQDDFETWGIP
jgi:hypothetical protein